MSSRSQRRKAHGFPLVIPALGAADLPMAQSPLAEQPLPEFIVKKASPCVWPAAPTTSLPTRGEGPCVFNDAAVASRVMQAQGSPDDEGGPSVEAYRKRHSEAARAMNTEFRCGVKSSGTIFGTIQKPSGTNRPENEPNRVLSSRLQLCGIQEVVISKKKSLGLNKLE